MRLHDRVYIFGYGSLLRRRETGWPATPCNLSGFRRRWNVAMDNTQDIPGYKYYVDAKTHERPAMFVTFLNIDTDPAGYVNGVVFAVDTATLRDVDLRERNYRRIDVRELLSAGFDGPVWVYVGTHAARRRYEVGLAQQRAVISRAYHDDVIADFESFGACVLFEFRRTTAPPDVPLRDLAQLPVPSGDRRGTPPSLHLWPPRR